LTYRIEFTPQALEDLTQLDSGIGKRIAIKIHWLSEHFEHLQSKILIGQFAGLDKLRVGDWRILYTTDQAKFVITVHVIAHRSKVYK
jgi:mRNA interferase RelE/StbE